MEEIPDTDNETTSEEQATPEVPETDTAPGTNLPEAPHDKPDKPAWYRRRPVLALLGVALVALVAAGWLLLAHHTTKAPEQAPVRKAKAATTQTVPADPLLAKFQKPTTGEIWDAQPTKVADLGYMDDSNNGGDTTYYKVGTHDANTIYMSDTFEGSDFVQLYEKAPDGTVRAIVEPNANQTYSADNIGYVKQSLAKGVIADTTIHYDSLSPPPSFSLGKGNETVALKYYGNSNDALGSMVNANTGEHSTTVATYGQTKLVKIERQYADTHLTAINYELATPISTQVQLVYTPIAKDLSTYSWTNGVAVQPSTTGANSHAATISGIVRGCGSASTSVSRADAVTDGDFAAAGKTADGRTVYAFADNNNPLVQKSYSEYKDYYSDGSNVTVISFSDFLKQHALIAYKDAAGEWLVYTRDEYAATGGCAKPVIYLYPTHTENVQVKVGAAVKLSDPVYRTAGWNVLAQPNGQLNVNGETYGSLFWEGQGYGLYPGITTGTVVRRPAALQTMHAQLLQQGLTPHEAADFMAYWSDKLPQKPYIRLTWFTAAQLNQLAPLAIHPKPDTLIRVFLDMDGYDTPPKLAPQHLASIARKGFTVVEWGGLTQSAAH